MQRSRLSRVYHSLDRPLIAVVLASAAYLAFLGWHVGVRHHPWSYFIQCGDQYCDRDAMSPAVPIREHSRGYDGQFFYRLAQDPFPSRTEKAGIQLDNPPYRSQRILYPLVVRLLSAGRPARVPFAMVLTNYLSLCLIVIALVGALYARRSGSHALWGAVLALYPGFLITLSRDLSEALAILLLLTGILLLDVKKPTGAALALALAVLARETTLLVPAALGICWLAEGARRSGSPRGWLPSLLPLVVYGAWQLLLLGRWGELPLAASDLLSTPFLALGRALFTGAGLVEGVPRAALVVVIQYTLLSGAAVAGAASSSRAPTYQKVSWVLYAALASLLSGPVWYSVRGVLRAMTEFHCLGTLILLRSRSPVRAAVAITSVCLWALATSWPP